MSQALPEPLLTSWCKIYWPNENCEIMGGADRRGIKVFTWHVHGSYLCYLSKSNFEIYIPVNEKRSEGYIGYGTTFPFGDNVHEVPIEGLNELAIDCVVFQSPRNYFHDQYEILSPEQRAVPKLYLEHNPPKLIQRIHRTL